VFVVRFKSTSKWKADLKLYTQTAMNWCRSGENKKSKIAGRIGIEQGDSLSPFLIRNGEIFQYPMILF